MADTLTARQFQRSEGTRDWRALGRGALAVFRTGTLQAGAELVERIGALADVAHHHPDIDLRPRAVAVRLVSHDVQGLSARDADLARRISTWARELDLTVDPTAGQDVELAIDALDIGSVRPFWAAVLGHRPEGDEDLADPHGRWPGIWFQQLDTPRPLRNRVHLDVFVPQDERAARVAAALAAGGHLANETYAPSWWTLADAEGNEADVEAWEAPETLPEPYLTPAAFRAAPGVEDWRFLQGASAYYPTDGLARGVELASAVADLAAAARLNAYADLRYAGTTIRVAPPEDEWMDRAHLELCRRIQAAARDLSLVGQPAVLRDIQLTFDALDIPAVRAFWAAVLGYTAREETDLFDPLLRGPSVFFQQMDQPRAQRNRIHVDVFVPDDVAGARVQAALAAGGRLVTDAHAPFWWTLADPEGNEVDVAVVVGRAEAG